MGETKIKLRNVGRREFQLVIKGIRKSNVSGNTASSAKNKIKDAYPELKVISEKRNGSIFGFSVKKKRK